MTSCSLCNKPNARYGALERKFCNHVCEWNYERQRPEPALETPR